VSANPPHPDGDAQATRASLLLRLRDAQDAEAWEQFVAIYTPLIYWFCCRQGLQEADAADVCQEVMRTVVRAMETFEYDPQRGKFRNWLLTVVRNKIYDHRVSQQRQPEPSGQSTVQALADQQAAPADESDWDTEYYRCVFQWAVERIRPSFKEATWQAFWRTAIDEQDGQAVAESLGLSLGAVYVAKSRVLARLREELQAVDGEGGPFVVRN
jgi:RNA polymerase sigma-70 factor (ECF subfamily)